MDYCLERIDLDAKSGALFKKHVAAVMEGLWKNSISMYDEDFKNDREGFYRMLELFSPGKGSFYFDAHSDRHVAFAESHEECLNEENGRIFTIFGMDGRKEIDSHIDISLGGEGIERGIRWANLSLAIPCPLNAVRAAGKKAPAGPLYTPRQTAAWALKALYDGWKDAVLITVD